MKPIENLRRYLERKAAVPVRMEFVPVRVATAAPVSPRSPA
jgi:hypothetical protein